MSEVEEREDEYFVEAIRGWRYNLNEKRKEFFIKWENYPEEENTWEPPDNLTHCPDNMKDFVDSLSPDQSKYFSFEHPHKLTGFQRNATFLKLQGVDGPHESDEDDSCTKEKKQKFYILARFDDSNYAEEVTLEELLKYKPEEAMKFCEERLLYRKESVNDPPRECSPCAARSHD